MPWRKIATFVGDLVGALAIFGTLWLGLLIAHAFGG